MKALGLHSEISHCPLEEPPSSSYQKMLQPQWLMVKARETAAGSLDLEPAEPILSVFVNMEVSSLQELKELPLLLLAHFSKALHTEQWKDEDIITFVYKYSRRWHETFHKNRGHSTPARRGKVNL